MSRMPILTSGRLLIDQQLATDPREPGDTRDFAALTVVETDDPRELSLAGDYWQTGYGTFVATGDVAALEAFEGKQVGGFRLQTDPDLVEEWADLNRGFDPSELYHP